MKKILVIITSILSYFVQAELPHLDLEASSREYQVILDQLPQLTTASSAEDKEIEKWLSWGKRSLQWVDLINSGRPEHQKISLTSKETQGASPVTDPRIYNFKIIKNEWQQIQQSIPVSLRDVIWGAAALPMNIPTNEQEFIKWLLQVDKTYQISARYKIRKPWQLFMSGSAVRDVRGFLNIKNDLAIDKKLAQWGTLNQTVKNQLTKDLNQICMNSGQISYDCKDELNQAIKKNSLVSFKNRYMVGAQKNYDRFFNITSKRNDVIWLPNQPNLLTLPFKHPESNVILSFLKDNIEDEWRFGNWSLNLDFIHNASGTTTYIRFIPGATPNVNGLAGSIITMDANAPLSEYNVKWTLRHEFGHVLGFPDCYFEFYDNSISAFVSYQLDVDDLMCSRRGKLLKRHYDELKRVYFN